MKSDDSCGASNQYKIGNLLQTMGHESVTLEYRIFLKNRFKDNGFVRFTAKWIKKDKNVEIIEQDTQENPMIENKMNK